MNSEQNQSIWKLNHNVIERAEDVLAVEEPLEIRVRGRSVSVTMRTPGHDEELAVGFLLSENIIKRGEDVLQIEPCGRSEFGNIVNIQLDPLVHVDFERLTRHVFASSSCGLCGRLTIDDLQAVFPPIESDLKIDPALLLSLPQKMRSAQQTFDRTGGLHAAAIFDGNGEMLVLREDVGRHNAVDKVIGHALMKRIALDKYILLVSGRASFEILQKSLAARIPIVAAVSAPSSLAVHFAERSKQALVGFLREGRMNIYAGIERFQANK